MKINRLNWALLTMVMLLASCQQIDENTVEFETLTADETVYLTQEENSPACRVSLKLMSATPENGHRGEVINLTVGERLFQMEEVSVKSAMDRFIENYTQTYRQTMMPLYNQDRADTTKRAWYEFHYIISADAHQGSQKTVVYQTTVDYYEGGAHGTNQQIIMNFEASTGRLITLKDVFAEGAESQLNEVLLKALIANKGVESVNDLKQKGYLVSTDIYAPDNFIIGEETITFIYNPSEIAPYAEGGTELIIPYTDIEHLLKNSFSSFII